MIQGSLICLERRGTDATLSSWLTTAMWQLFKAEQDGLTGYIYWPQGRSPADHQDAEAFFKIPNMFEWYFEQPKIAAIPAHTETRVFEDAPDYSLITQPEPFIKQYFQRYLRFNKEAVKRASELETKYGLNALDLIGVSWRGTDSSTDGRKRQPIESFFPDIDRILTTNPNSRIFAKAEEETVVDPLLKRYSNAFTIPEFHNAPFKSQYVPERTSPFTGYERGMQVVLMIWAFSRCRYLIKNQSNSGAISSYLSPHL